MASVFQKLLRKSPSSRTITSFIQQSQSHSISPTLPLFVHLNHFSGDIKIHHPQINLAPFFNSSETEISTRFQFSQIYPMFPFGFSVNPISSTGFVQSDVENVVAVDFRMNCADPKTEELQHYQQCSLIYPSFPFGCDLKPIVSSGVPQSEPGNVVSEDGSGMIWADSVKKKRKKKMNKHKYKKLKKSLRRKT